MITVNSVQYVFQIGVTMTVIFTCVYDAKDNEYNSSMMINAHRIELESTSRVVLIEEAKKMVTYCIKDLLSKV